MILYPKKSRQTPKKSRQTPKMKRRDSIKAKHHPETIEFMREFIKVLEEFPNGGAELFPFEIIDKLTKEYLDT